MKNGTAVKDRKGWVHFGEGQLTEFEYKKWQLEQETLVQKTKEKEWDEEKTKRRAARKTQKRVESIRLEKIYKAKEMVKEEAAEMRKVAGLPPKKEDIKAVVNLMTKIDINILENPRVIITMADADLSAEKVTRKAKISLSETAHNVGLSSKQLVKFLLDFYKIKSFDKYCITVINKHKAIRMPSGAVRKRNIRTWVHLPPSMCSFKNRFDCNIDPIVSTENKSPSERLFPAPQINTIWSKEITIVKDRTLQPIKRTRVAVHSFQTAGTWNNGQRLRKVSCILAKSLEDKYLTVEGGIIISRNFAHREHLEVGDKLLSVTGLKGVICEIRKRSVSDLIINKNVVWDETKMSRLCGSAVLELLNNDYKIFYQPEHQIRRFSKNKKVRFSPDLVPFLAYYLNNEELSTLQGINKKRFQDIMYMLNFSFTDKNGYLFIETKTTQVSERKGGKLYKFNKVCWGKTEWEEGLSEPIIREGKPGFHPFILKYIWIPDWFEDEFGQKDEEIDKDITTIFDKLTKPEVFMNFGIESVRIMYKYLFAHIPESISYLVAIPKDSKPNEIYLNKNLCTDNNIEEGDYVLLFRYPVVQKENVQKMKVVFAEIPDKTVGINIESMVLMNGDFDGDPLYLLKIPQTKDFGVNFEIPIVDYEAKRKKVIKDIEKIDAETDISLLTERKIKIEQTTAFLKAKKDAGGDARKLSKFLRDVSKIPTGYIRTDKELLDEAKVISDALDTSGVRAETIGTLTKWMWLTTGRDKKRDEEAIKCVASLEIIKDRAGLKNKEDYDKSVELLKKCKRTIEYENKYTGRYEATIQTKMFELFISTNTYKESKKEKFPKLRDLRNKPLIRSDTPYAKFILSLVKRSVKKEE